MLAALSVELKLHSQSNTARRIGNR